MRTACVGLLCGTCLLYTSYLYQWNNGDLQPAWLNNTMAEVRYEPMFEAA